MSDSLHVFSGWFESQSNATQYTQEQWEQPEPDDSWPAEKFNAYEARNPSWQMRDQLDMPFLDADFVETIFGHDMIAYLESQIHETTDIMKLRSRIPAKHNTLVLILSTAFGSQPISPISTGTLTYHGAFQWKI